MRAPRSAPDLRSALKSTLPPISLALLVLLAACARTPVPTAAPETLRIAASTATLPLLETLAAAYAEREPAVITLIDGQNSSQALAKLAQGTAALVAVSGTPLSELGSAPTEVWSAPIAVDAIAVVVHADNPLPSLTLAQLREVFSGQIWHWSELGVQMAEDEITVVSREEGSGTRAAFEAAVADPPGASADVTAAALLQWGTDAVVTYVAENRAAIGYVARGHLLPDADLGVRAVAVEEVEPVPASVAGGGYRLTLPFHLVALQEPTGAARRFVDFCLSAEGQAIVARGYVPVR